MNQPACNRAGVCVGSCPNYNVCLSVKNLGRISAVMQNRRLCAFADLKL